MGIGIEALLDKEVKLLQDKPVLGHPVTINIVSHLPQFQRQQTF